MRHLFLVVTICLLTSACIEVGKTGAPAEGAAPGGPTVKDPSVEFNLDGVWNGYTTAAAPTTEHWCTAADWHTCTPQSAKPLECSAVSTINGLSYSGGGFQIQDGYLYLSGGIAGTVTKAAGGLREAVVSIDVHTWLIQLGLDDRMYMTYGPGCILLMKR